MEGEALWIEGIGPIGQYYNYIDTLWERGIPYFVRDVYFFELQEKQAQGARARDIRDLVDKINLLNSKIRAYEVQCRTQQSCQSFTTPPISLASPHTKSIFQLSPGSSHTDKMPPPP
jgi:hypothetical protein